MASIRSRVAAAPLVFAPGGGFRPYMIAIAAAAEPADAPPESGLPLASPAAGVCEDEMERALSQALRFRAALGEALAAAVEVICSDLAARVLARDLRLAPVEVAAIARDLLAHAADEVPLALHAAPDDAASLRPIAAEHGLALRVNQRLHGGDVVLELRSGTLESTLPLRLAAVIAAHASLA